MSVEIRKLTLASASLSIVLVVLGPGTADAQIFGRKPKQDATTSSNTAKPKDPQQVTKSADYDELYQRYLEAARKTQPGTTWMSDLMGDARARHLNDLVTIRVVESLSASGTSDAHTDKTGKGAVTLPTPLSKPIAKVLPAASTTQFAGSGGTSRAADMTATMTARVMEVLPNGDLVVEGIRELEINGDRQVVVLSGVVRQADVTTDNIVLSSTVGQLQIRLLARGLVKDSLTPGWLIRMLNKVF
jgi:flagellar L-ring protein FlgH